MLRPKLTPLLVAWYLVGCSREASSNKPNATASSGAALTAASGSNVPAAASSTPSVASDADASPRMSDAGTTAVATGSDLRRGTLVLHIGDSFTHASFQQNLGPRFRKLGARYEVSAKTPSYTTEWAGSPELDRHLWSKPALILITLGANEWEMKRPNDHAPAVRALAKKVSQHASCVWITPPSWKPSTGIVEVIRDNCAPCRFFDSDQYAKDVERQRDGIHPNAAGGAKWADAFWTWLEDRRDPALGAWGLRADD